MAFNRRIFLSAGQALLLVLVLVALGPAAPAVAQQGGGSAARVEIDVKLSQTGVAPGDTLEAAVVLDIEEGWHANAHEPTLDYLIGTDVEMELPEGFTLMETRYPEPEMFSFSFADGEELAVYSGKAPIFLTLRAAEDLQPGRHSLSGTVRIQICNDSVCLPPSTLSVAVPVEVLAEGSAAQAINQELFVGGVASLSEADSEGSSQPSSNQIAAMFDERGALWAFLGIFLIGLALNLTPCVYPMLSVTVALFGGQEETRRGRSFARAGLYVLGIASMYSALGMVAAFTGGLFGAALQSPWVLATIGVLMLALALSMFGVYELRLPASVTSRLGAAGQASGPAGMYLSGLGVGVFAAPCIGPPTVALLAFVGSQGDPLFGFWAFTLLGLGLGLPYLVLGTFSGLLTKLPRSGVWMTWIKKIFGVVMVGAALFYLGLALFPAYALWTIPPTLVLGGLYLGFLERSGKSKKLFTRIKWAVGAAAILAGILGFQNLQKPTITWTPYTEAALEEARASGKPVLMDFYADWCIPCLELDRVTFTDERVIEATEGFARIKVDLTHYDSPEAEALREKFDVAGVPTLVFLDETGEEITEARVVGFMGPDEFLKRVEMVQKTMHP
jgi:thiol:disulfide interchange protein DsbD